jgi:UDP-glucose 4-epimerase
MRVLVTGATGLLGRGVTAALAEQGAHVVALIRPGRVAPAGTTPLVHDLREPFAPDAFPDVECVVHLAHHPYVTFPENATALHRLNTSRTQELLEAARIGGATRFVYASSGAVYGFSDHELDEGETPRTTDFYALTKLHAEALLHTYAPFFATTILRPFFPYGRGQRDRLISRLAERTTHGEPISLHADDKPRLNPIFVDDAVDAVLAAVEGRSPNVLNLAGPDVVSIRELATAMGAIVGRAPVFDELDDPLGGDLVGATNRIGDVLGRPLTSLEEGLRKTLAPVPVGVEPRSSTDSLS